MVNSIKIGTRGSKLALYQAYKTEEEFRLKFPGIQTEVVVIQTKGDKILDVALSKIGDKGLFTKEIENALLDKSIDIAVHSLKDLATEMPQGLKLGAVLERGEFRDALVHKGGKKLADLDSGDVIATSSLRRISGLRILYPNLKIIDIRGNVQTRLKKMEEGHCDGMIMAAAGLIRLGLEKHITQILEPEEILPAVGQGAIAIQSRIGDAGIDEMLQKLNDAQTMNSVLAERSFMRTLQGGCQVPVGAYTYIEDGMTVLTGLVSSIDGTNYIKESIKGNSNPETMGNELAQIILDLGGDKILHEIRNL